jgi:hypothetical protein
MIAVCWLFMCVSSCKYNSLRSYGMLLLSSTCYCVAECAKGNKTLPLLTKEPNSKILGSGIAACSFPANHVNTIVS